MNNKIVSRLTLVFVFAPLLILAAISNTSTSLAQTNNGLGGEDFRPPKAIDSSRKPQDGTDSGLGAGLTNNSNNDAIDSQGQRVFDALFLELDNMIPGEFVVGSEQKKAVEDAVTAFQIQDLKRVEEVLKGVAAQDKNFPPADLLLAALSYAVKDTESGLSLLERAAIDHPEYPGVYSAFARLAINQGRISDALAMFEKCGRTIGASELDSVTQEYFKEQCLDGLIDVAMQQRRYNDARKYLELQRKSLPENAKVLMVSAELEFHEDEIDKSLEFLNTLKNKFPASRSAESILASWFQQTGKAKETEKWIRAAAEKSPDDPQVQLEYASWAVNQEEFPTASSAINKAEKATSESLFSRNLKGKIAFCTQSYGVAEAHFKVISESQPDNFDASNMYALCLIENKDIEKQKMAREIAVRNFRALPDNLVAQAALGFIELKSGSTEQAKTILARAARTPGTAPEIDFFLASLLEKMGQNQQAKMVLDATLKHEGIFLYRSAAKKLLEQVSQASDDLPTPEK